MQTVKSYPTFLTNSAVSWRMARIGALLVLLFSIRSEVIAAAETNTILRAHVEFVASGGSTNPVYVSGDPIRIKGYVTNITDKVVSVYDLAREVSPNFVFVWAERADKMEILKPRPLRSRCEDLPIVSIPAHGSVSFAGDVLEYCGLSQSLYEAPSAPLVYEQNRYILQIKFKLTVSGADTRSRVLAHSEKLYFQVKPMERKRAKALLPRLKDKQLNEDARMDLFTLLLVNLEDKDRNEIIRQWINDSEPSLRRFALCGCERFRIRGFAPRMRDIIEHDEAVDVAACAIMALATIDSDGSVPILIKLVEQRKENCWIAAMNALTRMRARRAVPVLQNMLKDNSFDDDLKRCIRYNIAKIEGKDIFENGAFVPDTKPSFIADPVVPSGAPTNQNHSR